MVSLTNAKFQESLHCFSKEISPQTVNRKLQYSTSTLQKCTQFQTDSVLPTLVYHTTGRLNSFEITLNDVKDILKVLNVNKANGPDNISVKMIRLCGDDLCIPLQIIFKNILETGTFPD